MNKEPGRWTKKSAFVMPPIPQSLGIDPILGALLHCAAFLELSDDEAVDPDAAVEAMENVSVYLTALPERRVDEFRIALAELVRHGRKDGFPEELLTFLVEFLENMGVGDEDDE
jgi:hypothetical protein